MQVAKVKPMISYDDFSKVDIRVGSIDRVEDIQGSDKLVRLIVDFGDQQRTILAESEKD